MLFRMQMGCRQESANHHHHHHDRHHHHRHHHDRHHYNHRHHEHNVRLFLMQMGCGQEQGSLTTTSSPPTESSTRLTMSSKSDHNNKNNRKGIKDENNKCTSCEMEWLQLLAAGSSACARHQKEQLSIVLIQGGEVGHREPSYNLKRELHDTVRDR